MLCGAFPLVWESVGWYWEGVPGDQVSNSFWMFGPPWADKGTNGKESNIYIYTYIYIACFFFFGSLAAFECNVVVK